MRAVNSSPNICAISRPNTDNERVSVVDVAFDPRFSGGRHSFTYANLHGAQPGQIVAAPLGPRQTTGVVISAYEASAEELGFELSKLRTVSPPIRGVDLPAHAIPLAASLAAESLSPLASALALFIPAGVKERMVTTWELLREPTRDDPITPLQEEVLAVIRENGGSLLVTKQKPIPAATVRALRLLMGKKLVRQGLSVGEAKEKKEHGKVRLSADTAKVEAFLHEQGQKRPAQAVVLMRLLDAPRIGFTYEEIKGLCAVSDSSIKALVTAKLLEPVTREETGSGAAPVLHMRQQIAAETISEAVTEGRQQTFVLYGVTGSGKTEVYLRAAAEALKAGRQVLYLVPEIALTAQVVGQLRQRFGNLVAILHSGMTPAERLKSRIAIASGEAPVVLGPRSAVFAPFSNLGLIIMDEEHDAGYKQENSPRYHTKQAAQFLSRHFQCPLVLGSATPSMESFWEAKNGHATLLEMPERAAEAMLPDVQIVDLREAYADGKPSLFSDTLRTLIADRLQKGEQTVLFLNRRAYAPYLGCRDCGHAFNCRNCAVALAFHKRSRALRCHYCDHKEPAPMACPRCDGTRVKPIGTGTEKVEESVRNEFPNARVMRLDRDVAQRKGAIEGVLAGMRAGDTDILVGTQMVAKGLDFPNVTLVGVITADIALHLPDFRASERTFQLLSQVAGRAGRGNRRGEVVIQTFSPDHPAVVRAQNHDYLGFFGHEINERHDAGYPPFHRLVNIVVAGENRHEVAEVSENVAHGARLALPEARVMGPVDCAMERLQNKWRRHVLVKLARGASVQSLAEALEEIDAGKTSIIPDVDPYSML